MLAVGRQNEPVSTGGVWAPERRALTVGLVSTIVLVAFESLAVATILPDIKNDLDGIALYGWVFSAFFLGSIVGVVVAGQTTDHRGPAAAYALGLGLFLVGLLVGGLAPSMLVLVLGRAVQGFGAGAVPAVAYATIGRTYPADIRPRIFAILSTAWVVPGLLGPGLASAISHAVGWRWVFLGLVPLSVIAGGIALRPLLSLKVVGVERADSRLGGALRVAAGAALVLAGLTSDSALLAVPLVITGVVIAVPALLSLVPKGTLRAAPGLPAAVAVRGVLTFAFFGADAYIPLAIEEVRGATTLYAGVALTVSALSWTAGSWTQERLVLRVGARRFVGIGHAVLLVGIALAATMLSDAVPLWVVVPAWLLAGFGIGMAYAPISLAVLSEAAPGQEGAATAGMQLTDLLGITLGTGFGGAAVALGDSLGWDAAVGIGIAWAIAAAMAVVGILVARRLPEAKDAGGVVAQHGTRAGG